MIEIHSPSQYYYYSTKLFWGQINIHIYYRTKNVTNFLFLGKGKKIISQQKTGPTNAMNKNFTFKVFQAEVQGLVSFFLLDFVDSEAPNPYFLWHWSVFIINRFESPTLVLHWTLHFYLPKRIQNCSVYLVFSFFKSNNC